MSHAGIASLRLADRSQPTNAARTPVEQAQQAAKSGAESQSVLGSIARPYKSPLALGMMRAIKQALDPQNLLNPGRVLRA